VSTYWDVCCLDCDKGSGLHLNHGVETCREVIRGRDGFAALAGIDVEIRVSGECGYVDANFYRDHAGHALAPVSEYGDIDGDCNEYRPTGPNTTDGSVCRLAADHGGDHDYKLARPYDEERKAIREAAAERRRS